MNTVTLVVFLAFWPVWLVWEIVILARRAQPGDKPKTISMVARDMGWKMNSLVYLWSGLGAHFWWNAAAWAPYLTGALFWVIFLVLGVADWLFSATDARPWYRTPVLWMAIGALSGRFLFPQAGV